MGSLPRPENIESADYPTDGEIKAAMAKIKAALPDARLALADYDCSLGAWRNGKEVIVFQVRRPDKGRRKIVRDVDAVIEFLR